ncbi:MAG: cytochrome-c peroxidase [Kofleriaceae bacterium]
MSRFAFTFVVSLAGLALLASCPRGKKKAPEPAAAKHDAATTAPPDHDGGTATLPALPSPPPLPTVPQGLPPLPALPAVTPEAVAFGELLFWDARLSSTGKLSCASCHDPAAGFAGASRQDTADGKPNLRRAPALINLAWTPQLGWDGRFTSIQGQLASHIRGQLGQPIETSVERIAAVPIYQLHLARVGGEPAAALTTAISAYVLTRFSGDAPWDRMERSGDIPPPIKAGYQLFSGKAQCSVCHTPPLYTDLGFHRLGLIATPDGGRGRVDAAKMGAFRTPTLRGAAARKAFFHDASAGSLEAAVDWHLEGGTGDKADPSIVDIKRIVLRPDERSQLLAFIAALTPAPPSVEPPVLP